MLYIQTQGGKIASFVVGQFEYQVALSQCYRLLVHVLDLDGELAQLNPLLRPATLEYVDSTGETAYLSGLITHVSQKTDPIKQKTFFEIQIEPLLSLLKFERQFRVHNQQSYLELAEELVRTLAQAHGRINYADFEVTQPWLTAPIASHDVQCEAQHLDYFQKLLGFARYYFEQTNTEEKLKIIDQPLLLPTRQQTLVFDPSRKEDLRDGTASLYELNPIFKAQNLQANPFYFDPFYPAASLNNLQIKAPLSFEIPLYAPTAWYDFVKSKLTEQLGQAEQTYHFKSYYSHLNIGERLEIQDLCEVFVESLSMTGYYQDKAWRFDVSGVLRPYTASGYWLGAYQARKTLPALIRGAILQDTGQVNDAGLYQIKFPQGFDVGQERPTISVREIQETVTQGGGASHSVSGTADAVLVSQDGLPSDLLLMGSLIDNPRSSHIGLENYRDAGVAMKGGLNIHMRRQDTNNPYGEMGVHLKDSQGNPAQLTLGANSETLSELGSNAHGIIQQSTGYAKRVVSGNDRQTVGDVDYPVVQTSLVKNPESSAAAVYNQDMQLSPTGKSTLQGLEKLETHYYEDGAGNCTFGYGHLMLPKGRCGQLLHQLVSMDQINSALNDDINAAESIVKQKVTKVELTQAQFDALVCFVFNTGDPYELLSHVNAGWSNESIVNEFLKYKLDDAGNFEGGLLKRSQWEAVAFGYKGPFYEAQNPPTPAWGS